MTPEELREIDRRVAVGLGYRIRRWHENPYFSKEKRESLKKQLPENRELAAPSGHGTSTNFATTDEEAWERCPHFTTDPATTELVRLEIERRGGKLREDSGPRPFAKDGRRYWFADVDMGDRQRSAESGDGRGVALCLAFLAAIEYEATT